MGALTWSEGYYGWKDPMEGFRAVAVRKNCGNIIEPLEETQTR